MVDILLSISIALATGLIMSRMSIQAQETLTADGNLIKNITLFAILIYELIGPYLTKQALIKTGDIIPKVNEQK